MERIKVQNIVIQWSDSFFPHKEHFLKPKHWFVFLLQGVILSSTFMWIKIAAQEVSPITLVAFRVLLGLLFVLWSFSFNVSNCREASRCGPRSYCLASRTSLCHSSLFHGASSPQTRRWPLSSGPRYLCSLS